MLSGIRKSHSEAESTRCPYRPWPSERIIFLHWWSRTISSQPHYAELSTRHVNRNFSNNLESFPSVHTFPRTHQMYVQKLNHWTCPVSFGATTITATTMASPIYHEGMRLTHFHCMCNKNETSTENTPTDFNSVANQWVNWCCLLYSIHTLSQAKSSWLNLE